MADSDPANMEEYNAKFQDNNVITGFGLDVENSFPCPFCAAPDWLKVKIMDFPPASDLDITCKACGRTARMVTNTHAGRTEMELVQTGGEEPPTWLEPAPRRLEV